MTSDEGKHERLCTYIDIPDVLHGVYTYIYGNEPVRSDVSVKETTLKEPAVSPGSLPSGLEAQ